MKKALAFSVLALATTLAGGASAQMSDDTIKIGVLTDMSGPFSHQTGFGSVVAAQMAIDEFGGKIGSVPIELVSADHQNKPDVGLNTARQWLDTEKVDAILDLGSSAVALAVQELVKEKDKVVIFSGPGTDRLTNDSCSPNGIHWTYDTYATGRSMANAVSDSGGKKWFFIGMDNAFGRSLFEVMSKTITARGGEILGSIWHPIGTNDYSSFITQAQASGADVLAFANSGTDFVRSVKQAREFGITDADLRIVAPTITVTDILSIGREDAEGLQYVDAFYWDLNDGTRALAEEFNKRRGNYPGQAQAGVYSAVRAYLQAIEATQTDAAKAVLKQLHATEISDGFTPSGKVRADGRMVHEMYLMRAKGPSDSSVGEWDGVSLVAKVAGDDAFRPLAESDCPLVK